MTLRASLARYVRGLLEEPSTPTVSDPPTPSQGSSPPTSTPSTTTPSNGTSEAGLLAVVLETLERMQRDSMRETRELVVTILQGREIDPSLIPAEEPPPSRMLFDPPDYDDPGTDDLPGGLQAVFEREESERETVRSLRDEQGILAQQLAQARAALGDPQGPAFENFS